MNKNFKNSPGDNQKKTRMVAKTGNHHYSNFVNGKLHGHGKPKKNVLISNKRIKRRNPLANNGNNPKANTQQRKQMIPTSKTPAKKKMQPLGNLEKKKIRNHAKKRIKNLDKKKKRNLGNKKKTNNFGKKKMTNFGKKKTNNLDIKQVFVSFLEYECKSEVPIYDGFEGFRCAQLTDRKTLYRDVFKKHVQVEVTFKDGCELRCLNKRCVGVHQRQRNYQNIFDRFMDV